MLLGIVSLRAGGKIHYDAANRRVTNKITSENNRDGGIDPNQFLTRDYRTGWTLLIGRRGHSTLSVPAILPPPAGTVNVSVPGSRPTSSRIADVATARRR